MIIFEILIVLFRVLIVLPAQTIGMAAFQVANKYAYGWQAPAAAVAGSTGRLKSVCPTWPPGKRCWRGFWRAGPTR